jgi:hypothetical protein
VRFEVLTAVKMAMLVIWVVTPCGLVGRQRQFGETYCLHLQDSREVTMKMEFMETADQDMK